MVSYVYVERICLVDGFHYAVVSPGSHVAHLTSTQEGLFPEQLKSSLLAASLIIFCRLNLG